MREEIKQRAKLNMIDDLQSKLNYPVHHSSRLASLVFPKDMPLEKGIQLLPPSKMLSRLLKPSALRLLPSHSATSALLEGVARPTRSTLNSLSTNSTNLGKDGRGEEKSGVARRLSNLIQETLEEERHQTIDKRNILANLVSGHVRSLSLLITF